MPMENWGVPNLDESGESFYKFWGDQTVKQKQNVYNSRCNTLLNGINFETQSWEILTDFTKWCKDKGIKIAVTWPNLCYWDDYRNNLHSKRAIHKIKSFWDSLNVQIIGDPFDSMLNYSNFADTKYHLNEKGVEIRTYNLISELKPIVSKLRSDY